MPAQEPPTTSAATALVQRPPAIQHAWGRNRDRSSFGVTPFLETAAHTPSSATLESIPIPPGPPSCLALDPTARRSNPRPTPSWSTRKPSRQALAATALSTAQLPRFNISMAVRVARGCAVRAAPERPIVGNRVAELAPDGRSPACRVTFCAHRNLESSCAGPRTDCDALLGAEAPVTFIERVPRGGERKTGDKRAGVHGIPPKLR